MGNHQDTIGLRKPTPAIGPPDSLTPLEARASAYRMNEDFSECRDLIQRMEAAPQMSPPSGFTARVMARLPEQDAGLLSQLKRALAAQAGDGFNFGGAWKIGAVSKTECSFYFFITGFFYLIMGIVLMTGFKALGSGTAGIEMEWIKLQPHLTIGAAIWLLALGMVLMMDGSIAIKIAKNGTWLYIFSTVFNGILMWLYLQAPYAGVLIIGFVATSAFMGVMLALAVQKMELK